MKKRYLVLTSVFLTTIIFSCAPSSSDEISNTETAAPTETTAPSGTIAVTAPKVKFVPFGNVDEVRQKLSSVGIGELGMWKDDGMGGYMSITPYHEFGGETPQNNIAYYLESDNSSYIKTLKLVLNINNGDKKPALEKFADIIGKTFTALGMSSDAKMIASAKTGKELKTAEDTYTASVKLDKSRIETWKFVMETK